MDIIIVIINVFYLNYFLFCCCCLVRFKFVFIECVGVCVSEFYLTSKYLIIWVFNFYCDRD